MGCPGFPMRRDTARESSQVSVTSQPPAIEAATPSVVPRQPLGHDIASTSAMMLRGGTGSTGPVMLWTTGSASPRRSSVKAFVPSGVNATITKDSGPDSTTKGMSWSSLRPTTFTRSSLREVPTSEDRGTSKPDSHSRRRGCSSVIFSAEQPDSAPSAAAATAPATTPRHAARSACRRGARGPAAVTTQASPRTVRRVPAPRSGAARRSRRTW